MLLSEPTERRVLPEALACWKMPQVRLSVLLRAILRPLRSILVTTWFCFYSPNPAGSEVDPPDAFDPMPADDA